MQTESEIIATTPQPGHYDIDPDRSRVTFATRHLFGLGRVTGSFAIRGGTADVAEPIAASAIYAEIEAGQHGNVLTGTLTVCGTSRPVTLTITRCEASRGSFTARATARIDRTEFGITAARGLAARYLELTVEVRCARI